MRNMIFKSAALAATFAAIVATSQPSKAGAYDADAPLVYACAMGDRPIISLNFSRGLFHFYNHVGKLRTGRIDPNGVNFTTKAGYTVYMTFDDLDRIIERKPATISGQGQVVKAKSLLEATPKMIENPPEPEFFVCHKKPTLS